jgi:hypothetical protein
MLLAVNVGCDRHAGIEPTATKEGLAARVAIPVGSSSVLRDRSLSQLGDPNDPSPGRDDLMEAIRHHVSTGQGEDVDGDGDVDASDLDAMIEDWRSVE